MKGRLSFYLPTPFQSNYIVLSVRAGVIKRLRMYIYGDNE